MQKWFRVNKILVVIIFLSTKLFSQTDNDLIFEKTSYDQSFENKRKVSYLFEEKNAFIKYNPLSLLFGGMLYVYQKTISVQIGAACPYEVNCSNFSKQCIQKYGLLKGIPLTADRLTRCTKLAGIDMIEGVDYSARLHKIYDDPNDYKFKTK